MTVARLLVAAALVLLAGCTSGSTAADCSAAESQQVQEGSHLLGDQQPPVPYSSVPPTSGWHSSGRPPEPGTYVEPLSEPDQVAVLETGGIVVAYDPALPAEAVGALNRLPLDVDRVVVTPYETSMPSPITLTAWGVLQRCDAVTAADVAAFRDDHARTEGH